MAIIYSYSKALNISPDDLVVGTTVTLGVNNRPKNQTKNFSMEDIANFVISAVPRGTMTGVSDENITLTLGGTPVNSLFSNVSLTIGWNGLLADNRIESATYWNEKQDRLSGDGIVKSIDGTISYLTDNSSNWNTAYTDKINSAVVTGTTTKLLTLNQQDGGTITASWVDTGSDLELTTTGTSGVATLVSGILNIPNYTVDTSNFVRRTGDQSILGIKSFPQTPINRSSLEFDNNDPLYNSIKMYNRVANDAIEISNFSTGGGILINNTGGFSSRAIYLTNSGEGNALVVNNDGTGSGNAGNGIYLINNNTGAMVRGMISSSGPGLVLESDISSTGTPIEYIKDSVTKFKISNAGDATANSFIKTGGTSNQFLKADGSIDLSSYITLASLLTTSPLLYDDLTGTFSIQQANSSQDGYLSSTDWNTFNDKQDVGNYITLDSLSATSPLSYDNLTGDFSIQQATNSQDGYLSSSDYNTFDNKQDAGNYITDLNGEATASGPGVSSVVLNNAAVIAKVLTGLNISGGSVVSTDTILQAFGKLQNQVNALISGSAYQGVWDAATNTPTITSGIGSDGEYYVVNVAGNTNIDGITDWNIGDWVIFHGTAWQKVDNTDAVVSVNGQVGAVSLTTDNIPEGVSNLYYTDLRSRLALSFAAGSGAYNNATGVITIPTNNNQISNGAGYITNADLSPYLLISTAVSTYLTIANAASTYFPIPTGTTSQYVRGDGSLAIFPALTGFVPYTGATANLNLGTHTLLARDLVINHSSGSGVAASITKNGNGEALTVVKGSGSGNAASITGGVTLISELHLTTDLADAYIASASVWNAKQNAINLTTVGNSGPATFNGVDLNIPQYAPDLSGYVPTSRTLTINGTAFDLSANRSWNVGTVTSIGLTSSTSGVTIGSSPITSSGNISLAIATANGSQQGLLSSTDWNIFNNKAGVSLLGPGQIPIGSVTGDLLPSGASISGTMFQYKQSGSSVPAPLGNFNSDDSAFRISVYNGSSASLVIKNWDGSYGNYEAIEFASIGTAMSYSNVSYDWAMASGNILYNPLFQYFIINQGSDQFRVNFSSGLVTYNNRQLFQDYTTASSSGFAVVPMVGTLGLVNSGIEIANFPVGKVLYFYTGNSNMPSGMFNIAVSYQGAQINGYNNSGGGDILSLSNYDSSGIVNIRANGGYLLAGYDPNFGTYGYADYNVYYNQAMAEFAVNYSGGTAFSVTWITNKGYLFGKQIPVISGASSSFVGSDIPYLTTDGQLVSSYLSSGYDLGRTLTFYGGQEVLPTGAYLFKSSAYGFEINTAISGSAYQISLNNYGYPSAGIIGPGGPMIYNDAMMGMWQLMSGGIVYYNAGPAQTMTFNVNGGYMQFDGSALNINGNPVGGLPYLSMSSVGIYPLFEFNSGLIPGGLKEFEISYSNGAIFNSLNGLFRINSTTDANNTIYIDRNDSIIRNQNSSFNVLDFSNNESLIINSSQSRIRNSSGNFVIVDASYMAALSVNLYNANIGNYGGTFNVYDYYPFSPTFQVLNGTNGVLAHSYNTFSDISLKENIVAIPSALEKISKLEGVRFNWKKDSRQDFGFIAQQVKEVVPEVVKENTDTGIHSVNNISIIAIQNEAIKELKKQIDQLINLIK
jgi:hypothetical protein